MEGLYPLKFKPIPREMIWGGNNLRKLLNKDFPADLRIGESWEISSVPDNISVVSNGFLKGNNLQELIEVYMGDLVGEKVFDTFGIEFPVLVKFIDSHDVLSVQVHPDDELSARRHKSRGKTEMWYVIDAEPGAELITGFNEQLSAEVFAEKLAKGKLLEILNFEKAAPGDVFYIPAGRIHALGKGIVLAEIQQTSDITYRIYDWDRLDANGNPRQLHVDLAVDAIDYGYNNDYKTSLEVKRNSPLLLSDCRYFTVHRIWFDRDMTRDYSLTDSFVIYICTEGWFNLEWGTGSMVVKKGETVLIPALIGEVDLTCKVPSNLLEVYLK